MFMLFLIFPYRWLVRSAIVGIFVVPMVSGFKLLEMLLSQGIDVMLARIVALVLFLLVGSLVWRRYAATIMRPLLRALPR